MEAGNIFMLVCVVCIILVTIGYLLYKVFKPNRSSITRTRIYSDCSTTSTASTISLYPVASNV